MENLKFRVLGTAACEACPAYFCSCEACEYARAHGGKDIRTRTAYALGQTVRFDFGPDALIQSTANNLRGELLEHLFFTHSHEDHLYSYDLVSLTRRQRPLQVYGNAAVLADIDKHYFAKSHIVFHELHPGDTVILDDPQISVTALEANHIPTETALLYLVEHGDSRILIANDTDIFPENTFQALKGKLCRYIFIDCTWCEINRGQGHMGLPNNLEVLQRLKELGAADNNTKMFPTHIGHYYFTHHDAFPIPPAYDGMEVDF